MIFLVVGMIFKLQTLGFKGCSLDWIFIYCLCHVFFYTYIYIYIIGWHLVQMGGTHVAITKVGTVRQDRDGS